MRFFHRLSPTVNVEPLRKQIADHPELWNQHTLRTTHVNTAHRDVDDIWLRYNDWANFDPEHPQDFGKEHETVNYPAWHVLTEAHPIAFALMPIVKAVRFGGALITRVRPHGTIKGHTDAGWHVDYYNRKVYVTLEGDNEQFFWAKQIGEPREVISPKPGDVYHFDNRVPHGVDNHSDAERMTLILCYRADE
jgi:Aspartyl/Asparaginyl beta-hydroxylase